MRKNKKIIDQKPKTLIQCGFDPIMCVFYFVLYNTKTHRCPVNSSSYTKL